MNDNENPRATAMAIVFLHRMHKITYSKAIQGLKALGVSNDHHQALIFAPTAKDLKRLVRAHVEIPRHIPDAAKPMRVAHVPHGANQRLVLR